MREDLGDEFGGGLGGVVEIEIEGGSGRVRVRVRWRGGRSWWLLG